MKTWPTVGGGGGGGGGVEVVAFGLGFEGLKCHSCQSKIKHQEKKTPFHGFLHLPKVEQKMFSKNNLQMIFLKTSFAFTF